MPAKRQTWQLAEAREWLKRERPKIYEGLKAHAAKQTSDSDARRKLLLAAIEQLMPWAYARAWDDIEAKAARIFGPPKRSPDMRKKAYKIARNCIS